MKIRSGFVSNSSSSSFILAIKSTSSVPCPHCKRVGIPITEFFSNDRYDEDKLSWDDPTEYLREIQAEIDGCKRQNAEYSQYNPNEIAPSTYGGTATYGDHIRWNGLHIAANEKLVDKIQAAQKAGHQVIEVVLDNHNTTIWNILRALENSGDIEVIYGDEAL